MAPFTRQLGIAFGPQLAEGTADPLIEVLSGSLNLLDGIILGDSESGLVSSGITHSFERNLREKGFVSGSFTNLGSDFISETISLTFAFPLAGPRNLASATPIDFDFAHKKGIGSLLQCCGLFGAGSVSNPGVGWKYVPGDVLRATAKLFDSGSYWVIRDIVGDISISLTPAEIAVATCTLSGIVDSVGAVAFPSFDYQEQASVSAPAVAGVSPSWGISDEVRGWTDLTIAVANELETIGDSASSTGETTRQTGRTISVDMTMIDTDTDIDFAAEELRRTSAPTESLKALVGTPAADASDNCLAYQVEASNLEVLTYDPDVAGASAASRITARCTGTAANTEFFLAFQ